MSSGSCFTESSAVITVDNGAVILALIKILCVRAQVSGREVFEFRPELVDDDDDEADDTRYAKDDDDDDDEEEEEEEVRGLFTLPVIKKWILLTITVCDFFLV